MKLHATISMLSTMLLMGLHGATSPANCRDKTHMDTLKTGGRGAVRSLQRVAVVWGGEQSLTAAFSFCGYLWTC